MKRLSSASAAIFCALAVLLPGSSGLGALVIDDFAAPEPVRVPIIAWVDPDPTLIETGDPGILGGERDLLLDVIGTAAPSSLIGEVGGGRLRFGGLCPGTTATLQYDGVDCDEPGNPDPLAGWPAALICSEQLGGMDLTAYGHSFGLELAYIDGGLRQVTDLEVEVHSAYGGGLLAVEIPDSAVPLEAHLPFSRFRDLADPGLPADPDVFTAATSIQYRFNPGGDEDVDFELDQLIVATPEPSTLVMWSIGLLTLALGHCCRRRGRAA